MRTLSLLLLWCGCASATTPPSPQSQPKASVAEVTPVTQAASTSAPMTAPASAAAVVDDEVEAPIEGSSKTLMALPAASSPLKTYAMSGPFKTYEDFCKASLLDLNEWGKRKEKQDGEYSDSPILATDLEDVCPKETRAQQEESESYMGYTFELMRDEKFTEGPFQRLKMVHHQNMLFDMVGRGSVELVLQLKGGWYAVQLLSYGPEWQGAGGAGSNLRTIKELSVTEVIPGGEQELVLVITSNDDKGGRIGDAGFKKKELLFLCGLTEKGKPACYPSIRVSESEEDNVYNDETEKLIKKTASSWKLKEPYLKEGKLLLEVESGEEKIPARIKKLLGEHLLSFN